MDETFQSVWWDADAVCLIDQLLLPAEYAVVRCTTVSEVARAIRTMQVRGAPAIGCAAAYGMALCAQRSAATTTSSMIDELAEAKQLLDRARPTAVNLAWATDRLVRSAERHRAGSPARLRRALLEEAHAALAENRAMCHAIGRHGAPLIPERGRVLTHCNAGGLATAGYGTALAPIRTAHEQGRPLHVFVDETRPFLQGARLTAWELQRVGIDLTLITDNMAGYFMARGEVDCIIVGADRIAANGDVANKIGTYSLAVLARAHGLPFYVAAPSSTIDLATPSGDSIPIEQRPAHEVLSVAGSRSIAPSGIEVWNPAFDVTPAEYVTGIITERGIFAPRELASHFGAPTR